MNNCSYKYQSTWPKYTILELINDKCQKRVRNFFYFNFSEVSKCMCEY